MNKKTLASVLAVIAFACAPAYAQNQAPAHPESLAAAKELLEAMKYRAMLADSMREMVKVMPQQIRANMTAEIAANPRATEAQKIRLLEAAEKSIPEMVAAMQSVLDDPSVVEQLGAENAAVYARIFNADELRQLNAFYRTSLGQKMLASAPQLTAEAFVISNRILIPRLKGRLDQLMKKFREELMQSEIAHDAAERARIRAK